MKKILITATLALCAALLPAVSAHASKAEAVYFYSAQCEQCRYVMDNVIPRVQKKYGPDLAVQFRETGSIENFRLLLEYEKRTGRKINKKPPIIFIGSRVLQGKKDISDNLDAAIGSDLKNTPDTLHNAVSNTNNRLPHDAVVDQFRGLGVFAVISGGLIDGINPCAFTTLIFLLSYLAFVGRRGRQLVKSGLSFSIGVFTAYMGIGIGLFEIITRISVFSLAAKIIQIAIALAVFILGVLSIYDFIQLKKGRTKNVTLQLGAFWKKRIHSSIREKSKSSSFIMTSLILGFMIGLFEFPCTGQVYLPIVIVIREISAYRIQALSYLLLYNLLFILPLLIVFAIAYWGVSSDSLAKFMQKKMALIKLATAVFFFAIAGFIVLSLFI